MISITWSFGEPEQMGGKNNQATSTAAVSVKIFSEALETTKPESYRKDDPD